jgi:hypothetical protein
MHTVRPSHAVRDFVASPGLVDMGSPYSLDIELLSEIDGDTARGLVVQEHELLGDVDDVM